MMTTATRRSAPFSTRAAPILLRKEAKMVSRIRPIERLKYDIRVM